MTPGIVMAEDFDEPPIPSLFTFNDNYSVTDLLLGSRASHADSQQSSPLFKKVTQSNTRREPPVADHPPSSIVSNKMAFPIISLGAEVFDRRP
jgi:hypothetical protein